MGSDITLWLESIAFVDNDLINYYSPIAEFHFGRNSYFFQILRDHFEEIYYDTAKSPTVSGVPECIARIPQDVSMDIASACLIKVDKRLGKYTANYDIKEWNTAVVRTEDAAGYAGWFINQPNPLPYTGYFLHGPNRYENYYYKQDLVNSGHLYYEAFEYVLARYVHDEKHEPRSLAAISALMRLYQQGGSKPRLVYWFDQ